MTAVKRALISCADKQGLDRFARMLADLGVELLASGGTAAFLKSQGLRVRTVEEFAGLGEQLDGRVKTLHPKIHGGILARRDDPTHVKAAGADGLIDLVVVNLYPFRETIARPGVSVPEAIEQIDIGGVALLRAAAKNFAFVGVVCHPGQYDEVGQALRQGKGELPEALRRRLAVDAFRLTAGYDGLINEYLAGAQPGPFPEHMSLAVTRRQALRYGENPHQQGAWYEPADGPRWGLATLQQLQGKELSYNNLLDIDAAFRSVREFTEPACVIVKHTGPCGLAVGGSLLEAYQRALACDPESAFGGIVGFNRPLDDATAETLAQTFLEVIAAPAVKPEAAKRLSQKKNLRLVTMDWAASAGAGAKEWRQLCGAWLCQEPDRVGEEAQQAQVVTRRTPSPEERADLEFAWRAVRHARSNAIVIASRGATVGIGQGHTSRVGAVRMAIERAQDRARESVAASDAFFPFPDGLEQLAEAGVKAVIHPGGSVRDQEVIEAANRAGVAMLITGVRHFRH